MFNALIYSLKENTTAWYNTGFGHATLENNTTGEKNTALGYGSLKDNISGTNNTAIGFEANNTGTNGDNNTVIGANAEPSSTTVDNEITLGDSSIATLRCQVTSITALSDARDKTEIKPLSNATAFIKDLKPVQFDWDRRDGISGRKKDMGFLAQDLDDARKKHGIEDYLDIVYKENPEALEAAYGKLLPILVQALKEQQAEIDLLKKKKKEN